MSDLDTVSSTFGQLETIINNGVNAVSEQSLHEFTAPANLTALYMVDERTATSSILKDLIGLQLCVITARVAQAFELRNTVKGISVIDHIKSARLGIKENKSLFRRIFGLDSIEYDVTPENEVDNNNDLIKLGSFNAPEIVERQVDAIEPLEPNTELPEAVATEAANIVTTVNTKNILSDAADTISNFAVGSLFDITLKYDGEGGKYNVTLGMRISPVAVTTDVVKAILGIGSYKNTFIERFYSFKAGDISLREFLTFSDITDQQVSVLLKDKSGYYKEVLSRQAAMKKKGIYALLYREKIERAKTIGGLILDSQTLAESEVMLGGSFDNPDIRNRVFMVTSAATICVIDENWQTVKIYYRGIDYVETYTFNQIRRSGKNSMSVEDMLEAFRRGGAPKL